MLSELVGQSRSRLSADYTALDQQLTSFTPIESFKITNQKNKFQPENEVRFKYFNETLLKLFPRKNNYLDKDICADFWRDSL